MLDDSHSIELIVQLILSLLSGAGPAHSNRTTARSVVRRRRLVNGAREALHEAPSMGLTDLARHLTVSPSHLSRCFIAETGYSFSGLRRAERVRRALDLLEETHMPLAQIAVDAGFVDQAHLTRDMRSCIGLTPRAIARSLLRLPI